ncbi:protease modulator HflC [Poseidonocella sedimentorum]|uniref:Protease FtsH subunit HflC n=1 Tax=Poseidonocella sedimentorum TaxID=871652 RepID=A0A1I6CY83_9RHOB|nr:protease modulator HflC [Poseidonocella sedimentorum]SFQ98013.1 protease FtsH subunit HflC [Poseidonocella sedimentorum]
MRKSGIFIAAGVVVLVGIFMSLFIVDEREKALVLQFGQIRQVVEEPGLGFKVPLIQEVVKYDDRILSLDTDTIEVTPSDDRRLVVDAFARYRIADVVQFRQAVGVGGIRAAEVRLSSILNAQIREVLGADQVTSDVILSPERRDLALRIRAQARTSADSLGLEIVDVRLKQTNLPEENLEATFARMRAEREREAADEIARGNEAAQRVRAAADRTVVETVSNAEREAEITRGEADAERNRVYAEAFGDNPDFFAFYRSLTAFERTLQSENSTLVISPDSEFIRPLFEAIRAEGLEPVQMGNIDLDALREMAPETGTSPDLPEAERLRLEEDAAAEAPQEPASEAEAAETEAVETEAEAGDAEAETPTGN